jgi:nicotinate-nucleotide adenylyltransferase
LAQEAASALDLQQVRFIPAGEPWQRSAPRAPASQRLEMVKLACAGNPLFKVDDREIRRHGPSYTVDTLAELRAELGPEQPLCLLLGADAFLGLASWHRWQEIFGFAHCAVAHRPGFASSSWADSMPPALQQALAARQTTDPSALAKSPAGQIMIYPITPLDISASHIRTELQQGKSPRYLVPDAVLDYISQNQLYSE